LRISRAPIFSNIFWGDNLRGATPAGGGGPAGVCTSCVVKLSYLACQLIAVFVIQQNLGCGLTHGKVRNRSSLFTHDPRNVFVICKLTNKKVQKKSLGWDFDRKQDVWDVIYNIPTLFHHFPHPPLAMRCLLTGTKCVSYLCHHHPTQNGLHNGE
jgi:hypothetical protein